MASFYLRLLQLVFLLLLCISQPILLTGIPITRTRSLEHASLKGYSGIPHLIYKIHATNEANMKAKINRRMDVELHDYPGSGANNRHTPKPPQLGKT